MRAIETFFGCKLYSVCRDAFEVLAAKANGIETSHLGTKLLRTILLM